MNMLEQNPTYSILDMNNYPGIPTPPSSIEDSPQPSYYMAVNSNTFVSPSMSPVSPSQEITNVSVKSPELYKRILSSKQPTYMDTDSPNLPYLTFIEQPTDKFRFRYRSEMAGTHGSLNGINSDKSRKQTFPTVEVRNVTGKAVIRCSIYQVNCEGKESKPHAHRLIMKRGKEEYDDPHNITVGPDEGYVATFHSMGIIHTAKKNIVGELTRKKIQLKKEYVARMENGPRKLTTKEELEIKGCAEAESKSINLNIVCLRFDAFYVINDVWHPICAPIYSHGINNLKSALTGELKIVRMDHCTSSAKGGKEIFVLVERVTKKNIKIRFFELDDNDSEVWEAYGKFTDLDVHHQYAIVFKTPEYHNNDITSPVKVYMELIRPSDNARSEPKEFTYVPNHDLRPGSKRPRPSYCTSSSSYDSSNMASDEIPATIKSINASVGVNNTNSWGEQQPVLSSEDLEVAMNNIDSDEFQILFASLEKNYLPDSTATMSNDVDSHVKQFNDMQITEYQNKKKPPLKKHTIEYAVPQVNPVPKVISISNYEAMYVPVKIEVSDEDIANAKRTYNELKGFINCNYTRDRAIEMLNHYLGADGKTNALHVFVCQNKMEEINFLLKMIYHYFKEDSLVNIRNYELQTPLQLAVLCRNELFVKYIVKCGANVSMSDRNGNTALHLAVENSCSTEIIEQLLSADDAFKCINCPNNDGNTPLVIAIEKSNMIAVKLLCIKGTDINRRHNKNGFSPLRFAVERQNADIIRYLLSLPTLDMRQQDDFNSVSPFVAAQSKNCSEDIMEIINRYMTEHHYVMDLKQEVDDESDEEMEEEELEIKTSIIPTHEVEQKYKNVTRFTDRCLDEISAILDASGKWEDLADLLDLSHMIRSGMIMADNRSSLSRNLLVFAVEKNNDKILDIRNFLENLDEISAVEALDRMVQEPF